MEGTIHVKLKAETYCDCALLLNAFLMHDEKDYGKTKIKGSKRSDFIRKIYHILVTRFVKIYWSYHEEHFVLKQHTASSSMEAVKE